MKKKIFSILAIAAVAFTSCKKDDPNSSELGEATINGSIWAELDLTNTTPEGIEGMQVTVIVNTENWDQDPDGSYTYDDRVYTTTVAADGSYSLTIPATEVSYSVDIMFGDIIMTRTLAGGETQNVEVSADDESVTIYAGATVNVDTEADIDALDSNESDTYGSATMYGYVYAQTDIANWDAASPGWQKWTGGALNVSWYYSDDAPYNSSDETVYEVAVQADGSYSITMPTEESTGGSSEISWGIFAFTGSQTINNNAGTADSTREGIYNGYGVDYDNDYFSNGDLIPGYDIYLDFSGF